MEHKEAETRIRKLDEQLDVCIKKLEKKIKDPSTPPEEKKRMEKELEKFKHQLRTQSAVMRDHVSNNGTQPVRRDP